MNLKELVKEIAVNQKRADTDLEAVPRTMKSSMQSMVVEAKERLTKLKEEYLRKVRSNTLGVFVFGGEPQVKAFGQIAGTEAGVLILDVGSFYTKLGNRVFASMGPEKEFAATQLHILIENLKNVCRELDIKTINMPAMASIRTVKNQKELDSYVRELVRSTVDDELLRFWVDRKIGELAIQNEFSGAILPIALVGADHSEVASLAGLFSNTISVEIAVEESEVNKDFVLSHLSAAKKKIKNTKNQETK